MLDEAQVLTLEHDMAFLQRALAEARKSLDPATKVGSVLVNQQGLVVSWGCNSFPFGLDRWTHRMHDRELKLPLVVHAEMNAILTAARVGRMTDGCTLYLAATDGTGLVWGGPPCSRCTVEIIQAGITRIVSYEQKSVFSKWAADLAFARSILEEVGLPLVELPHG